MSLTRRLIRATYKRSLDSEYRIPVAALLHCKGSIILSTVNRPCPHRLQRKIKGRKRDPATLHAELRLLLNAPVEKSKGSLVVVVRRKKDGTMGLARPCAVCELALREAGVKKVIYSIGGTPDEPEYGVMRL